jgi:hypothetical protein
VIKYMHDMHITYSSTDFELCLGSFSPLRLDLRIT